MTEDISKLIGKLKIELAKPFEEQMGDSKKSRQEAEASLEEAVEELGNSAVKPLKEAILESDA